METEKYSIEARSRWGNTDAYREHEQKTKNYTKEKWSEANDCLMAIFAEFAVCKESGASADSVEAQALVAMLQASRGGMVALAISIALSFRMFSPAVPKNVVRSMYKLALVIIPLMVVYFIAVSVSRFEEAKQGNFDSAESSYVMYLGESMLYFDDGVMNGVTEYAEGGYLFDIPEKISQIKGDHFGVHFMTFIGCLYLDFGPYGTLIYALLVAAYWRLFMQKKRKGIPELFFLLTYLMYLFNGVFVMGYGYGIQWIEAIFIYIALRVAELIYRKIYKVEEDELGVESAKLLS